MLRTLIPLTLGLAVSFAAAGCETTGGGTADPSDTQVTAPSSQTGDERTGITITGGATFTHGATLMPVSMSDIVLDSTGESFEMTSAVVHVNSGNTVPGAVPGLPIESVTLAGTDYHVIPAADLNAPQQNHTTANKYFTIWVVVTGTNTATGATETYDAKRALHPHKWDPRLFDAKKRP